MSVCLVTGGAGFIGSHLVDSLVEQGDSVVNFDRRLPRPGANPHKHVMGNIAFNRYFKYSIPRGGIDTIYHLAAEPWSMVKPGQHWIHNSERAMKSNILGTMRMLTEYEADLFVFTSTASLYGNGRKFKENDPLDISSSYGYTKAVGERMVRLSDQHHVIFRFGTVVGTRGRCFPNRLVWCAVNNVPVKIFNVGDTYRDLIDVRDVVSAMLSAKDLEDGIYNISCGMEISGKVLAHQVFNEAHDRGYDLQYNLTDFVAPGYVPHSTLDISKVLETGVWKPEIPLKQTISDLFDYYEQAGAIEPPRWDRI